MKASELTDWLEKEFPSSAAEDWDNVGLLVGDDQKEISHIFLALDLTDRVLEEAVSCDDTNTYIELDLAFHAKIMKSSRNQYIYDIIKGFSNTMLTRDMLLKSIEESFLEHKTIFNSLSRREAIAAKTAMEYHLNENSRVKLRELLKREDNGFFERQ